MVPDEKDRLRKKLEEREKAAEESFFAEKEKEALRKLREKGGSALIKCDCPRCGSPLTAVKHHGVGVEECPNGHGMWLDQGQIELIASRERDSWLGKLFHVPKPQR